MLGMDKSTATMASYLFFCDRLKFFCPARSSGVITSEIFQLSLSERAFGQYGKT
jgi:hypothetical protein